MFNTDNSLEDSIQWLKEKEGFRANPYKDFKQNSIGYGTGNTGLSSITPNKAEDLLRNEVITRRAALGKDYPQGISPWGKLALDDRLYNSGVESVRGSKFLNALKGLDEDEAERQLQDWNKVTVDGQKVEHPGLTNRLNDLRAKREPSSLNKQYDPSKSQFAQSEMAQDPAFNQPADYMQKYKTYLQRIEDSKKYKDDGFRMAGVEGGKQPTQSVDLNSLFSNDVEALDVLPKTSFSPIKQPEVNTATEEISPEYQDMLNQLNTLNKGIEVSPDMSSLNVPQQESAEDNVDAFPNRDQSVDDIQPKEQIHPLVALLQRYEDRRNQAEESANKQEFLANMVRAAQGFTSALGRSKADTSFAEGVAKDAQRGPSSVDNQLKNQLGVHKLISDEKQNALDNKMKESYYKVLEKQAEKKELQDKNDELLKGEALSQKKMDTAEKRFDTFQTKFNADVASSRTDLGMNAKNIRIAQDIKALIEGRINPDQFSNIELKEMAMAMNSLFSPTGVPSMRVTQSLTPDTFKTDFAKWLTYAKGSPAAAKAGGFANLYGHIVDRQAEINLAQLKQKLVTAFAPYAKVEGIRNLPQTQAWMQVQGITDEDIEKALQGKYTKEALGKELSRTKSDMVRVKINGVTGSIPRANLEKAKIKHKDLEVLE